MAITLRPKGMPQKADAACPFGRTALKPTVEDQKIASASRKWAETAADLETARKTRLGRPPSSKVVVSLRLDPDVIAAFRATGPGWQARINEALRKVMP